MPASVRSSRPPAHPGVYRAPMRSRSDDVDPVAAVVRALARGLVGTGGVLDPVPADLSEALARTEEVYDERTAARLARFAAVPDGAYVWTRDGEGDLRLGRVEGPWTYDATAVARRADLVHVRRCSWSAEPVLEARAPAAVLQTFARGGRNFQRIHPGDVERETAVLWQRLRTTD